MIVTCPGCASKYRVRNEAVPTDGARMRCPKCDTLFLAKPPAGGDMSSSTQDDPSSMFQQLNPSTTNTGPIARATFPPTGGAGAGPGTMPPRAPTPQPQRSMPPTGSNGFGQAQAQPPGQAAPPGVGKPQSGPITSLFQAFDAAQLPPEMQRPQPMQPPVQPPPSPSGLSLDDGPKMRLPPPTSSPVRSLPDLPSRPSSFGPSRAQLLASWVAVVVGGAFALFGLAFFAWTTETLDLDGAMMPLFENTFGREPPASSAPQPGADELRKEAEAAAAAGDGPRAVVLYRRVKARAPNDQKATEGIAKILSELNDIQGVQQ